ncbi:MAG: hypothetical protein IKF14_03340 [Atopobiaceae bacterium]|nr:hypothetical protein [Atopobiaceae bacterium]
MRTKAVSGEGFTKAYAVTLRKAHEAGLSANEILVYLTITRYSAEDASRSASMPTTRIAETLDIEEVAARKALASLCRKTFSWNGAAVPVLTRTRKGGNGRTASYRDNITAYRLNPAAPAPGSASPAPTKVGEAAAAKAATKARMHPWADPAKVDRARELQKKLMAAPDGSLSKAEDAEFCALDDEGYVPIVNRQHLLADKRHKAWEARHGADVLRLVPTGTDG